jgi:hypothetical protein
MLVGDPDDQIFGYLLEPAAGDSAAAQIRLRLVLRSSADGRAARDTIRLSFRAFRFGDSRPNPQS